MRIICMVLLIVFMKKMVVNKNITLEEDTLNKISFSKETYLFPYKYFRTRENILYNFFKCDEYFISVKAKDSCVGVSRKVLARKSQNRDNK